MKARMASGREIVLRGLADVAGRAFARLSPRDTNRYVRAWIEAVGQAGSSPMPLPALVASKGAEYIRKRITRQWVDQHRQRLRLEKLLSAWYPPGRKIGAWGRKKQRELEKMKKREERLAQEIETLAGSEGVAVILIGGRGKNGFATVRTKYYGGRGHVDVASGIVYLSNMEPHAAIIESKFKVKRTVNRLVKMTGAKIVSIGYWGKVMTSRASLGMRSI